MRGCQSKASHPTKVRILAQLENTITVPLCLRHKNDFNSKRPLLRLDLKADGRELLLGETRDRELLRFSNDTIASMREQAKATGREHSLDLLLKVAQQLAKVGEGEFLFGFYFGRIFARAAMKDLLGMSEGRTLRAQQLRSQMRLKQPYMEREHPDISNELTEICSCGHDVIMHDSGDPRGACFLCLCPRYEFEQRLTRTEVRDLQSLIYREVRKSSPLRTEHLRSLSR